MDAPIREDAVHLSDSLKMSSVSISSHSSLMNQRRLSWICSGNPAEDELLISFNSGASSEDDGRTTVFLGVASGQASLRTTITDSIVTFWQSNRRERSLPEGFSEGSVLATGPCSLIARCCHRCLRGRNRLLIEERTELMDNARVFESDRSQSATAERAVQVEKNEVAEAFCALTELCDSAHFFFNEKKAGNLDEAAPSMSSLRCHLLFSSPLCIERAWTVTLTCQQSMVSGHIEAEAEVLTWGLEFNVACPSVVECVKIGGHIAAFNTRQEHAEWMVRPGDELWQVSLSGCTVQLRGQTAASALRALLLAAREVAHTQPMRIGLMFRGLRAMKQLCVEREIAALQDSGCEVQTAPATAENIRSLLATQECRILHLIFHSSADQDHFIILEDRLGKAHVLRSEQVHRLLTGGQGQQQIALVVLNSCHSLTLGRHFIDAGVRHVVCVRDEDTVRDESCWLFASHFFKALGAGKSVQEAFDCGVTVLECSQEPDIRGNARAFVLLPEGGDHTEVFAPGPVTSRVLPSTSFKGGNSWGALFPPIEDFLGREVDVYQLLRVVERRRFVEVHGEHGIGKTALLSEVGRFLLLRQEVFREVRWVSCSQACMAGLEDLHTRLQASPRHRVLLLIDTDSALAWPQVQALLQVTKDLHVLVASTGHSGGFLNWPVAIAAGLKPMRFPLRPLDPLAQAQLLLRRVVRPLFSFELLGEVDEPLPIPEKKDASILCPRSPAELLILAGQPRLQALGGNPARIVALGQQLSESPPAILRDEASATLAVDGSICQMRVRLVRPDGKTKDEWIPKESRIADVLDSFAPRELGDSADIFIAGCRAQLNTPVSSFEEDPILGMLVIEFRLRDGSDW